MSIGCWSDSTCVVCPARDLPAGQFDVTDRPGPWAPYNQAAGYRISRDTGTPVCVHPYRVGLPAGAYASAGIPVPARPSASPTPTAAALELPDLDEDLEGWLVAVLRCARPEAMASALSRAETIALRRFPTPVVITAMRRVLSTQLVA